MQVAYITFWLSYLLSYLCLTACVCFSLLLWHGMLNTRAARHAAADGVLPRIAAACGAAAAHGD